MVVITGPVVGVQVMGAIIARAGVVREVTRGRLVHNRGHRRVPAMTGRIRVGTIQRIRARRSRR